MVLCIKCFSLLLKNFFTIGNMFLKGRLIEGTTTSFRAFILFFTLIGIFFRKLLLSCCDSNSTIIVCKVILVLGLILLVFFVWIFIGVSGVLFLFLGLFILRNLCLVWILLLLIFWGLDFGTWSFGRWWPVLGFCIWDFGLF